MANNVEFRDCSISVKAAIKDTLIAALYEAAGAVVSQTAKNTRVDTGQLKGSWTYAVDEAEVEAAIGSPLENAIWEEFGTGLYALNGDGRKVLGNIKMLKASGIPRQERKVQEHFLKR